jgi:uncharacterized RDD family membrane protein YckC
VEARRDAWRRGVVTPEGVVLDLELAGVGSRAVALLLDLLTVAVGVVLVLAGASFVSSALPTWSFPVLVVFAAFAAVILHPLLWEVFSRGRSPGKLALGLRVMTVEGGTVRFRHAAIRAALGLVDIWLLPIGGIGLTTMLLSGRVQRLGDLAAGTVVVRTRVGGHALMAVAFPPPYGYEAYATSLDVTPLPAEQFQLVRAFLLRASELTPAARHDLARQLAASVCRAIGHVPPPGLPHELVLACVAHSYQRRTGGGRS